MKIKKNQKEEESEENKELRAFRERVAKINEEGSAGGAYVFPAGHWLYW